MSDRAHDNDDRDPLTQRDQSPMTAGSDRRTFLKSGLALGGSLALARAGLTQEQGRGAARQSSSSIPGLSRKPPNILVILVDQMRSPVWTAPVALVDEVMPNLAALRRRSVSFERHYTASNDCTPSRSTLSRVSTHIRRLPRHRAQRARPGFPTWGDDAARAGLPDVVVGQVAPLARATLEPWGFSGGTFPSPNGGPGQGVTADPHIATSSPSGSRRPAATGPGARPSRSSTPTTSSGGGRFTEHFSAEREPPRTFTTLPGNFETPRSWRRGASRALQRSLQDVDDMRDSAPCVHGRGGRRGLVPAARPLPPTPAERRHQVGRVLATLEQSPAVQGQHGHRVHLRPRGVRRLPRAARQGRRPYTRRASGCRCW